MKTLCFNYGALVGVKKLTSEQQQLAEKYWDMAGWLCAKYPIPFMDFEEMHAEALIRICRAARSFKPELGIKFATFAVRVWINWKAQAMREMNSTRRGYFRTQEIAVLSKRDDESELPMECRHAGPEQVAEVREEVGRMLSLVDQLPPSHRRVIEGLIVGKNYSEMGREFGISRERVRQIAETAREKLKSRLEALEQDYAEVA